MRSRLDPTAPLEWRDHYADAERRRRRAGWRRADELRTPQKRRRREVNWVRVIGVVLGAAALVVVLTLVIPS
jgi:hypothetical protein